MADEDEERNKNNDDNKHRRKHWRDKCIGIWTRRIKNGKGMDGDTEFVCNGFHVIKVDKDTDIERVRSEVPEGRGLTIVLKEMNEHQKREHERLRNREKSNLGNGVLNTLRDNLGAIQDTVRRIFDEGFNVKDMASTLFQTTTKILSDCKPSERLHQVYDFTSDKVKRIGSYMKNNSNDKDDKK